VGLNDLPTVRLSWKTHHPPIAVDRVPGRIQPQEFDGWCWVAVTQLVTAAYGRNLSQCEIATQHFAEPCCLGSGSYADEACNRRESLKDSLCSQGHFKELIVYTPDPAESLKLLNNEIKHNNPVCFRLRLDSRGHFIAVTGISGGSGWLEVQEPYGGFLLYVRSPDLLSTRVRYRGLIEITHAYRTRR